MKKFNEINLTKHMKDLTMKLNYLRKTLKKPLRDGMIFPCSCIRRSNIVKMAILLEAIYRVNAIPMAILMRFFTEIEKYLKIHMEVQEKL